MTFYNLGVCFESLGRVCEALEYYQYSLSKYNNVRDLLQFNDMWKISLRDTYQMVYTSLWVLLVKEDKVMEAFVTVEEGRAQALNGLLKLTYALKQPMVDQKKK